MKQVCYISFTFLFFCYQTNAQIWQHTLDSFIYNGIQSWHIPGMSAIVVQDGATVYQKCYGTKHIHQKDSIDSLSLFSMASTTKAITAMAMAILVDEKKISWDDKVIDHIPEFRLTDEYVSQNARIKDLLCHNLGLEDADKLWVWDSLDNTALLDRLQHFGTVHSIRSKYKYSNVMYIVASEVISRASAMDWRVFIKKRLLEPIGMHHTVLSANDFYEHANHAHPHVIVEGKPQSVLLNYTEQVGAAGCIWSCMNDMKLYCQFLSNKAKVEGKQLISSENFDYLFRSHMITAPDAYSSYKLIQPDFYSYGLGWHQISYRGKKIDFHTGSLAGMSSICVNVLEDNLSCYFFFNRNSANFRHALMFKVIDLLLFDDHSKDWLSLINSVYGTEGTFPKKYLITKDSSFIYNTCIGTYTNKKFGNLKVFQQKGKLYFELNKHLLFQLNRWKNNIYLSDPHPEWLYRVFLSFVLNDKKMVSSVIYKGHYIEVEFNKIDEDQ